MSTSGRGAIRTRGTNGGAPGFEPGALDHSATLPSCYICTTMRLLLLVVVLLLSCSHVEPCHYPDDAQKRELFSYCKDKPNECQNGWWVCLDQCQDEGDFLCREYTKRYRTQCAVFRGVDLALMRDIREKYPTRGYLADGVQDVCKGEWDQTGDISLPEWHYCQKLCVDRPEYPWYSAAYPWCRR